MGSTASRTVYASASILASYFFAIALLALLTFTLTRDALSSVLYCVSVVGWWGWPLQALGVASSVGLAPAVVLSFAMPISTSLALGSALSARTKLGLRSLTYISTSTYYIAGTLYFTSSGRYLDVGLELVLPVWLALLLVGVAISDWVLRRARRGALETSRR